METPNETTLELIDKFKKYAFSQFDLEKGWDLEEEKENAKQIAIIHCNLILESFGFLADGKDFYSSANTIEYYKAVLKELEK